MWFIIWRSFACFRVSNWQHVSWWLLIAFCWVVAAHCLHFDSPTRTHARTQRTHATPHKARHSPANMSLSQVASRRTLSYLCCYTHTHNGTHSTAVCLTLRSPRQLPVPSAFGRYCIVCFQRLFRCWSQTVCVPLHIYYNLLLYVVVVHFCCSFSFLFIRWFTSMKRAGLLQVHSIG